MDDIYSEDCLDIHSEVFDKDFDEVGWDPEVVDDSDKDMEELFGLK